MNTNERSWGPRNLLTVERGEKRFVIRISSLLQSRYTEPTRYFAHL
jgi:hypothetical protein